MIIGENKNPRTVRGKGIFSCLVTLFAVNPRFWAIVRNVFVVQHKFFEF